MAASDFKGIGIAPKCVPFSRVLKVLYDWTTIVGASGAATGQSPQIIDLDALPDYHEGLIRFEISMQNNSATPAGAGANLVLKYAFFTSNPFEQASNAPSAGVTAVTTDAVTAFAPVAQSVTAALPNVAVLTTAGSLFYSVDAAVANGRYLAVWYDRPNTAASSSVKWRAQITRI